MVQAWDDDDIVGGIQRAGGESPAGGVLADIPAAVTRLVVRWEGHSYTAHHVAHLHYASVHGSPTITILNAVYTHGIQVKVQARDRYGESCLQCFMIGMRLIV